MEKNFIRVYFYEEPFEYKRKPLPVYRKQYVETVNLLERQYSIMVWRLLETIMLRDFGIDLNSLSPRVLKTGRWVFDKYCISWSHSGGYYAIAISNEPIGVDVQKDTEALTDPKRWSKEEIVLFKNRPTELYLITWTRKESLYKFIDPGIKFLGNEKKINTIRYEGFFRTWFYDGYSFIILSICSGLIKSKEKYDFFIGSNLPIDMIEEVDVEKICLVNKL